VTFVIAVGCIRPRRRRPGVDDVMRTAVHCGSCRAPIGEGEIYALVTEAHLRRCMDCAVAITQAGWEAQGWCPWPAPLPTLGAEATVDVAVDFAARLRAALARSTAAAHRAA
jgi:hypothetical protein